VPQIVEPHAGRSGWSTISELPGQPDEHDVGAHLVRCSSPDGDEQVVARGAEPCPGGEIGFERLAGRWLQGNQPLLAKLAVADDQAILDQIFAL
jgi:hypothetical protein